MRKYATGTILGAEVATKRSPLVRTAHRAEFQYEPRLGYIYVRSRMISSRCNDNFDHFGAEEIAKGWPTFIGRPVFTNHHNEDHRRARGVIIDAALHEDRNPDGSPDTWVEGLHELDALTFPKLARAILAGDVARTSMGVDVEHSICSVCGNRAETPLMYCQHVPGMKGRTHYRVTASGQKVGKLIYESCYGLNFFENSFLVEDPADPTAFVLGKPIAGPGLEHLAMARTASRVAAPVPVPAALLGDYPGTLANGLPRPSGMERTAALSKLAHGGVCPVCHGGNTISVQASAECFDCEAVYPLGAKPSRRHAAANPTALPPHVFDQLAHVPAHTLAEGDRFFRPDAGMAYSHGDDGAVRSNMGFSHVEGTPWTVHHVRDGYLTAAPDGGEPQHGKIPEGHRVLKFPSVQAEAKRTGSRRGR